MGALDGWRVVEWGGLIAAPYCAHLLQSLGARVDKIEPPGGDPARAHGPFPDDVPDAECSGLYVYLNSGKRSVVLDVECADDAAALQAMVARADVLVTDQPLALRRRLGLDPASLRERFPRLIAVNLSVFGDEGPYAEAPAQAIDAYALSGTAWVIGEPGREPLIVPLLQADYQAGAHGAAAVLMAALAARRTGERGERIDIASADIFAAAAGTNGLIYLYHGLQKWARAGRRAFASGGPYPYVILPCKDGAICLIGRARQEWARLVKAMGEPEWTRDPRYQDLQAMGRDYPEEVDALIQPWLARYTRAELLAMAEQYGFPAGPLRGAGEVLASPQFEHRRYFRDIPHPRGTPIRVPGVPWKLRGGEAPPEPAPALGEHTRQVLAELSAGSHGRTA